jgi:hypothetical protein
MGRSAAIALALGAAVLLLVGALTTGWWSYSSGDWRASMGLQESRFCGADGCRAAPLGGHGGGHGDSAQQWLRAGMASYVGGFLAGGLLLAMALMRALRRPGDLLIKTAMVACASALVSALAFIWQAPDYPGMSPGYSMYAYLAGSLLGLVAGVVGLRMLPASPGHPDAGATDADADAVDRPEGSDG